MAGEVIVDALPYIDQGYDEPGIREASISMVEDEKRGYRPSKNYLEHLPPLNTTAFETELMRNEFDRLQQRLPMETMNMKRYELPPPPAGKLTDMSAWNQCLENSMAQLKHQATRITNLELMTDFGTEAWKCYLEVLVGCVGAAQAQLAKLKYTYIFFYVFRTGYKIETRFFRKIFQEVNFKQKNVQMQVDEKLRDLEANWVGLVSKNYEIELVCTRLEKQIKAHELADPKQMDNE